MAFVLIGINKFVLFFNFNRQLTWADVYLLGISNALNYMLGYDFTQNHPNLKRVLTNTSDVATIKAWIEKRPKTAL